MGREGESGDVSAPTLRTARLELRAVRTDDAAVLHDIFTQPGVRQFLFDDQVLQRQDTDRLVESWLNRNAWVIHRPIEGDRIGAIALTPIGAATARYQPTLADSVELVIAIAEQSWGWGIAVEAGTAVVAHGFDTMGLDRIVAVVDLPNTRSHLLMKRLGFLPREESDGPKYLMRGYEALRKSVSK